MSTPQAEKKPMKFENCVVEEQQSQKMSAKKALKKCKEYESKHTFKHVQVDARTIKLIRID